MPKPTFLNLPGTKRETILSAAFHEFAVHDYRTASISRIVREAGIAKGSMYQYFENKQDLYVYLINTAIQEKFESIASAAASAENDFFEQHKQIILSGTRFDFEHPVIGCLLINAMNESDNTCFGGFADELIKKSECFLERFIQAAVEGEELRPDIDVGMFVHVLNNAALSFGRYLQHKYRFSLRRLITGGRGTLPLDPVTLEREAAQLMKILEYGLRAQ